MLASSAGKSVTLGPRARRTAMGITSSPGRTTPNGADGSTKRESQVERNAPCSSCSSSRPLTRRPQLPSPLDGAAADDELLDPPSALAVVHQAVFGADAGAPGQCVVVSGDFLQLRELLGASCSAIHSLPFWILDPLLPLRY
jgi:hypothetical protein